MSTSIEKEVVILNPSYSTIFPPENLNTLCDQNGGKNNGRKIEKNCVANAAPTFPPDSPAGKELNKKRRDTVQLPLTYNFHSLLSVGDKLLSSKRLSAFQSFYDYYINFFLCREGLPKFGESWREGYRSSGFKLFELIVFAYGFFS